MSIPDELHLIQMISDRGREVLTLSEEVKTKMPKQASQRIPRIMRRRAASHQPKRIPRSCRVKFLSSSSGHQQQQESKASKSKERKRRIMKKHINPQVRDQRIERRNRKPSRTLLHVWHAKRFHMEEMFTETEFPIDVPIRNCTKNQRNLYRRAKVNNCFYYMTPVTVTYLVLDKDALMRALDVDNIDSKNHHLHHIHSQSKLIPIQVVPLTDTRNLLVSTHRSVAQDLLNWMTDKEITVDDGDHDHEERIRLVGPRAGDRIKQYLGIHVIFPEDGNGNLICNKDHNMIFLQGIIGDRPFIDILLSATSCKPTWQALVRNRGHLVGGLLNMKMLHFNAGQSFFPDFGYAVGMDHCYQVIQDHGLSKVHLHQKELEHRLIQMDVNARIPVCLTAASKGNVCTGAKVIVVKGDDHESNSDNTAAIVEFGAFCMQQGCGKGITCLSVASLLAIIRESGRENDMTCWIRNPLSDTLRCVRVSII